jgi:hypothetical protein
VGSCGGERGILRSMPIVSVPNMTEATFRTLAASRFSHTSLAGKGIIVTV